MKKITQQVCFLLLISILAACGSHEGGGRYNYALIKSKLTLTKDQVDKFDEITREYTSKAKSTWESLSAGDPEAAKTAVKAVYDEQDVKIKELLNNDPQYTIYATEIKIEREGREEYNMKLIKEALILDSLQTVQFELANEAFYKTLYDNHDNYHGKPDVYLQYYAELDGSRKEAFKKLLSEEQYKKYLQLADKYKLGKSEH